MSEDSDGRVEVCAPTANRLEPAGPVGVRIEPARREAYTELTKRHDGFAAMAAAHHAVSAWVEARGHRRGPADREVYHPNWATAAPDEHVVDVAVPFGTEGRAPRNPSD
ncbi:hypothetical protein AB0K51_27885 [Kitasatospora sp. NPDC049285]|uniref:hypothetical protein n=1 Tax=Kitasatospora sp. NPDC049285 TaxID=3157096 RepID=UPI0034398D2E